MNQKESLINFVSSLSKRYSNEFISVICQYTQDNWNEEDRINIHYKELEIQEIMGVNSTPEFMSLMGEILRYFARLNGFN